MQLSINGNREEIPDSLTVHELLYHKDVESPDMVSVALNGTILKREEFPATVLREGDEVEFLYFMGGGSKR